VGGTAHEGEMYQKYITMALSPSLISPSHFSPFAISLFAVRGQFTIVCPPIPTFVFSTVTPAFTIFYSVSFTSRMVSEGGTAKNLPTNSEDEELRT
jgi:hypothetical protein